jgi:imidazole glycerol-phosphate synthase subunit HisH
MGWSAIQPRRPDSLIAGAESESRFYFVHSYRVVPDRDEHTLATSDYGVEFASMVRSDNVMGAQFHPEKSHTFGMTVLKNFSAL